MITRCKRTEMRTCENADVGEHDVCVFAISLTPNSLLIMKSNVCLLLFWVVRICYSYFVIGNSITKKLTIDIELESLALDTFVCAHCI